ncbi:MAG: MFS transporter [Bdellovibrionales bacterium]|nr:MFS transporter [Bdellovibrionales bacterium]
MSRKWLILTAGACGTFMATLDSSIVNIALPTLTNELASSDLAAGIAKVKWVVISYLLTITCLILPFGRIADQWGRKHVFVLGFMVFTGASALCGLAPTLTALIASRVLQGVGAAMIMANGPAVIAATFAAKERGKALGVMAMVVSAGLIAGPSLGGILIVTMGWRSIFLVNIPVGLLGIYLVWRQLPRDPLPTVRAAFDWAGTVLQAVVLGLLIVLFDPPSISVSGGTPFPVPRLLLGALVLTLGAVFVKVESLADAPLFDLSLLRIRTFWTAIVASFLMFLVYSFIAVLMPFFLETALRLSPRHAGYLMATIPIVNFVVAPLSGRASDQIGSQELSTAGSLLAAVTLFLMAGAGGFGISARTGIASIAVFLGMIGFALGLFQTPNNNAIMGQVPNGKLGVASALLATVRNLGLVIGTGLAVGVFAWRGSLGENVVESLRFSYVIAGGIGVLATIASLGKRRGAYWNQHPEEL